MKLSKSNLIFIVALLGFISLGIPDEILGIAWVDMYKVFNKELSSAGIIMSLVTAGTMLSTFLSPFFITRYTTRQILCASTILIIIGQVGFSISKMWYFLLLFCIPLGLGAGTVDTSLNNYASKHFEARHMNLLHSAWGVGATIGTIVMTNAIKHFSSWRVGYMANSLILFILLLIFIFTKKIWNLENNTENIKTKEKTRLDYRKIIHLKPILSILFFYFYTLLEVGIGLWAASVMVKSRGFDAIKAGGIISMYWGSLTVGRLLLGTLFKNIKTENIIKYGLVLAAFGMVLFSFKNYYLDFVALILYGFSISGLFPCMMSYGGKTFKEDVFDILCSLNIGFASIGICTLPAIAGILMNKISLELLPYMIIFTIVVMLIITNRLTKKEENV